LALALLLHQGVKAGVIEGLFFGVSMAVILAGLSAIQTKGTSGSQSPRQHTEIFVEAPLQHVRDRGRAALVDLGGKIIFDTSERLSARTSWNWRGAGELIRVDLASYGLGTRARISTRPRIRTTISDFGRGLEIIGRLERALRDAAAVQAAAVPAARRAKAWRPRSSADRIRRSW
jgi:hypothetical protein